MARKLTKAGSFAEATTDSFTFYKLFTH